MRFLLLLLAGLLAVSGVLRAAADPAPAWNRVAIPPVKTSIYVGSVTLTTGEFKRDGLTVETDYSAKVFPWAFWNETGRITITLTGTMLDQLARGETADFTGAALNHKGKPRTVTGRAYPASPTTGKIKVRIAVDGMELVFNGTYTLSLASVTD